MERVRDDLGIREGGSRRLGGMECCICGRSLSYLPIENELNLWANQEWQPMVCGEECGQVLMPYYLSDFYSEASARQGVVEELLKKWNRGKAHLDLPIHLVFGRESRSR